MKFRIFISVFVFTAAFVIKGYSQKKILSINDFKEPIGNWYEASNAKVSTENEEFLEFIPSKGMYLNDKTG